MKPRVYLAARYSRHQEMLTYAADLAALGYDVKSEWITGAHDATTDLQAAIIDWDEVRLADIVVSFTEEKAGGRNRGGRHVEFGIALGLGKRCIVVGHRENVFHFMPQVEFYATWAECLATLPTFGGYTYHDELADPDPARCPAVIVESLKRYADHGVPTGDFLRAVLENDLKEAVGRADHINGPALAHIVSYCYNEIPSTSWGSPAKVEAWIEKHRANAERTEG
jgi:hypothetical protein